MGEVGRQIQERGAFDHHYHHGPWDPKNMKIACTALIRAYMNICSCLFHEADVIVERGDSRFIRNVLNLMYSSVMVLHAEFLEHPEEPDDDMNHTIKARIPPKIISRRKQDTRPKLYSISTPSFDGGAKERMSGSPTLAPAAKRSPPTPPFTADYQHELSKLCLASLRQSCRLALSTLPMLIKQLNQSSKEARARGATQEVVATWQSIVSTCVKAIHQAEVLESSLSSIKIVEAVDSEVSRLFYSFVTAWTAFGDALRLASHLMRLSTDMKQGLFEIQKGIKEAVRLMIASTTTTANQVESSTPASSHVSSPSTPLTPLQASLGPAVQAIFPPSI